MRPSSSNWTFHWGKGGARAKFAQDEAIIVGANVATTIKSHARQWALQALMYALYFTIGKIKIAFSIAIAITIASAIAVFPFLLIAYIAIGLATH